MTTDRACRPDGATVIHEIQMRAFAEDGRLGGTVEIPPLMESMSATAIRCTS